MRMWRLVVAVSALAMAPVRASVLYSTNGTATPGYFTTSGSTASKSGSVLLSFAMQFTPTTSGTVDSIAVAVISLTTSITSDNFLLTTDSSGTPGTTLDTFSVPLTTSNALESANSTNHPLLTAGTKYWLEISAPASNGSVRWDLASPVTSGRGWNSSSGAANQSLDAFEISGTADSAPEPASFALAGLGLAAAALAALRRRAS